MVEILSPVPNLFCLTTLKVIDYYRHVEYEGHTIVMCPHCSCDVKLYITTKDQRFEFFNEWHAQLSEEEFIEWKLTHA